jgi:hypothetical protein
MRRLLTGVTMAALLAAGQAGATASGVVPADRASAAQSGADNQMMGGGFGAGWLVVALGLVLLVVAVVDNNDRHDAPSSP